MRRAARAGLLALGLGGCGLPVQSELDGVSRVAHYATRYDHVIGAEANLLDRALAECREKTSAAETACLRDALVEIHPTAKALAALVPGCRVGRICHYEHTTRDRLGFVEASATIYVKRWRVDLDLRKAAGDASQIPVAAYDRDAFDGEPAGLR